MASSESGPRYISSTSSNVGIYRSGGRIGFFAVWTYQFVIQILDGLPIGNCTCVPALARSTVDVARSIFAPHFICASVTYLFFFSFFPCPSFPQLDKKERDVPRLSATSLRPPPALAKSNSARHHFALISTCWARWAPHRFPSELERPRQTDCDPRPLWLRPSRESLDLPGVPSILAGIH